MLEEIIRSKRGLSTVRNKQFNIQVMERQIVIDLPAEKTVQDLLTKIREHHQTPFPEKLICLKSLNGSLTLDYLLSIPEERAILPVSKLKQHEWLVGVYKEHSFNGQVTLRDFIFERCIGKGGTSEVYLVRHSASGRLFALKMIKKQYITDCRRLEQILREKKILTQVLNNSAFIIPVYATFAAKEYLCFLLEYSPGGEMFYHLQTARFTDAETKLYICEVICAMEELHTNKVLYRDLKPENILIDMRGHIQLTDFGLSKLDLSGDQLTNSFCGSPEYMPPEIVNRQGYTYPADFYTLGCLLYELLIGLPPHYSQSTEEIFLKIQQEEVEYPEDLAAPILDLLQKLLKKDISKRIQDFQTLKKQKWFHDVDWNVVKNKRQQMPIYIDLYQNHIHTEFLDIDVTEMNQRNLKGELEPIEDLFDFFNYLNEAQKELFVFKPIKVRVQSDHLLEKKKPGSGKKKNLQLNIMETMAIEHTKGLCRTSKNASKTPTSQSNIMPLQMLRKSFQNLITNKRPSQDVQTLSTVLSERPLIDKNYIQKMLQQLTTSNSRDKQVSPPPKDLGFKASAMKRVQSSSSHMKQQISQRGSSSLRTKVKG